MTRDLLRRPPGAPVAPPGRRRRFPRAALALALAPLRSGLLPRPAPVRTPERRLRQAPSRLRRGLVAVLLLLASPSLAASLPEGVERIGLSVDGLPRQALIEPPAEAGQGAPLPTLILLHDMGQSAREVRTLAALDRAVPFRSWLRVFPEGGAKTWNAGRRRVDGGEAVHTPDVAFLRALVAKLAKDGLADPSRIVLAGFGEGGAMVLRTLCEAPGLAMGAAVVAASWPASLHCGLGRPTPILVFNGAEDPAVPFHGGQAPPARKVGSGAMASVDRTLSSLAALNLCGPPLTETAPGGLGRKRVWFACEAPMMHWKIARMGHRWPGAPDPGREGDGFGPPVPPGAPDATLLIAGFFVSLVERPGP